MPPGLLVQPGLCGRYGKTVSLYDLPEYGAAGQIASVASVMKVGDTVSDIREGKNAGVFTVGILEGSSALGLSESEYRALPEGKKQELLKNTEDKFLRAGADAVVKDIRGILEYL